MFINQANLFGRLIEGLVIAAKRGCITGIKRRAHVKAIQPHLIRVPLLVPEPAIKCARLCVQLLPQNGGRLLITFLVRQRPQREHGLAGIERVQLIFLRPVTLNAAIR